MPDMQILIRLVFALAFGAAIGLERRWHGHIAGPHTNALVAFGTALFVAAGQDLGGDGAARALAQVATGIGFLAGGVILRDGLKVQGLNTAGTIWCTAAIGGFTGLGNLVQAAGATVLLVVANAGLHWLERRFDIIRPQHQDDPEILQPTSERTIEP
jgi:putative Mg2+ transporter-C (MgtC) family protein